MKANAVISDPSTADAVQDDSTIRKCVSYAKHWRFGSIKVVDAWGLACLIYNCTRA